MPTIFQIAAEGTAGCTDRIAEEIGFLALQKGLQA